jgi:hypothetical protein
LYKTDLSFLSFNKQAEDDDEQEEVENKFRVQIATRKLLIKSTLTVIFISNE